MNIHREFALNYWEEENYVQSRYHFLHSTDGDSFAKMLIECHLNYGYPSEVDLFLAQGVLQYLCLRNVEAARQFYESYTRNHHQLKEGNEAVQFPLLNFLKYLFLAIQQVELKWFNALIAIYKPSLKADPSFGDYLERIGQYFFNLKPKKVEKENIFNNLFRMFTNPAADRESNTASNQIDQQQQAEDEWTDDPEDNDLLD